MKKEQLVSLGIADELAEQAVELFNQEMEKHQQAQDTAKAELDSLKSQLKDANKKIEEFKGMDIDAIQKAADEYKAKFEESERKAKADLENLQFNYALDSALQGAKAKNTKAVKALLDMENLKLSKGEIIGLKEQLEKVKTENDYLFTVEEKVTEGTGFTKGNGNREPDVSQMTYSQMVQYAQDNPNVTFE